VAAKLEELAPQNPQVQWVTYQIARQMMDQSLLNMMMAAPDSAEMHMIMAGELARQGDGAKAIAQYREAIKLNPMIPGAHFQLAEQLRTSPDPALNAQMGVDYYEAVQKQLGAGTADFFRFYTVPGMFHCNGGVGCDRFDMLGPLVEWVEQGKAPERIVASKMAGGMSVRPSNSIPNRREWRATT